MNRYPATDEKDLRIKLREGDYTAFTTLYHSYAQNLIYKLKKLVLVPEIAEEFHQDIFMAVWEERECLPLDIPFATILYRKARSLAYNYYRKAVYDEKYREQFIEKAIEHSDTLREYLDFKETNEVLMISINKLPEQRRKIFIRIKIEGKSYEEVAEECGVSLSTIKDHMTRALKFIRNELSKDYSVSILVLVGIHQLFNM